MTRFKVKAEIIITSLEALSEKEQILIAGEAEVFLNSLFMDARRYALRFHFEDIILEPENTLTSIGG